MICIVYWTIYLDCERSTLQNNIQNSDQNYELKKVEM